VDDIDLLLGDTNRLKEVCAVVGKGCTGEAVTGESKTAEKSSAAINTFEAVPVCSASGHLHLMVINSLHFEDFSLNVDCLMGCASKSALKRFLRLFKFIVADKMPWSFGSKAQEREENGWPRPL